MLKWNHIMDCQPEVGEYILRIEYWDVPDKKPTDWLLSFKKNNIDAQSLKEMNDLRAKYDGGPVNYWWMYAKDFTFPELNKEN